MKLLRCSFPYCNIRYQLVSTDHNQMGLAIVNNNFLPLPTQPSRKKIFLFFRLYYRCIV